MEEAVVEKGKKIMAWKEEKVIKAPFSPTPLLLFKGPRDTNPIPLKCGGHRTLQLALRQESFLKWENGKSHVYSSRNCKFKEGTHCTAEKIYSPRVRGRGQRETQKLGKKGGKQQCLQGVAPVPSFPLLLL